MSSVLDWFGSRRREKALNIIERHMGEVMRTVKLLNDFMKGWSEDKDVSHLFDNVKTAEKNADFLRRETARLLTGGTQLGSVERTLLLRLMGRVDRIADWALETARVISIINPELVPRSLRSIYVEVSEMLIGITRATLEALRLLHKDPLKALEKADIVENLEEEIDAIYSEKRAHMLREAGQLAPPLVVLLYDALNSLENAADACEDTCDILREVVVRLAW